MKKDIYERTFEGKKSESMEAEHLDSWEAFEGVVKRNNIETEELKNSTQTIMSTTAIIYRGQADSRWHLERTLERKV